MTSQTAEDIERQLERDRAALALSIERLKDQLSPAELAQQARSALAAQAAPLVNQLDRTLRAQPLIAGLAGVALAALVFGRSRAEAARIETPTPVLAGTRYEALTRWEDEGGPVYQEVEPKDDWFTEVKGLRARAAEMLDRIDDLARRRLAPAAEVARYRADVLAALGRDTRAAMGRGLETLTGKARDKAILARERLYASRLSMAGATRDTARTHPLAVGAGLAALGAVLACAFPMTETEDALLGEARDDLVGTVKRAARDEVVNASDFARTLKRAFGDDMDRVGQVLHPGRPVVHQPAWR